MIYYSSNVSIKATTVVVLQQQLMLPRSSNTSGCEAGLFQLHP
jgi:hypothetical protein